MMQRRHLLPLLAAPLLFPRRSLAQGGYPNKPIKMIVGFPPGGGIDFVARTLEAPLSAALGQPVVIENRPGVGGVIAATELTRAAPDGYTLLIANTGPFAIAPYLQAKMPYDPLTQFTYIGQIAATGYIAVTRSDHPAKDLKQFVAWARANPAQANYASGGNGSSTHMNGELLNLDAGLDLLHVPYKGSAPAVQDVIGGQVQLLIDAGTVLLAQIRAGRLKALAVTGSSRDPQLPDVPTAREQGFNTMEAVGFQGLVAPPGLPRPVRDRLATELAKVLALPEIRARFAAVGSEVQARGPTEFASFVKTDIDKWSTLIRERKIKVD